MAFQAVVKQIKQEAIRQRLIKRMPKAKANVAMGRRLLGILFAMMRDQADYRRSGCSRHTTAANHARSRKRARKGVAA